MAHLLPHNRAKHLVEVFIDALELLKQDHQKVKELLERAQQADQKQRKHIFQRNKKRAGYACSNRGNHLLSSDGRARRVEGYGAGVPRGAQADENDAPRVVEAFVEQRERFRPKLKALRDDVEHHAVEEEEGKMFPQVRKVVDKAELDQLGEELEAAKNKRLRKAS
jgi:hemerythrin-like domain-containing protein